MKLAAFFIIVTFGLLFENTYGRPQREPVPAPTTQPPNNSTHDDFKMPFLEVKPKRVSLPRESQILSNNVQIFTNQNQADKGRRQKLVNNVSINNNQNQ
ncbi:hypothetical protein Bhyg_04674 [Pseudolycoriella hygida]|uniref:Uncharacterized protein n=1 Tax=Pseudolycoriella hygida TaxID=35572 RepID=A0A9Q0NFT7_9DIPT|nr:hypothetical protein Bhyg_04674 [Pseudolycoriella hygida]